MTSSLPQKLFLCVFPCMYVYIRVVCDQSRPPCHYSDTGLGVTMKGFAPRLTDQSQPRGCEQLDGPAEGP